jgi:restriction system protein
MNVWIVRHGVNGEHEDWAITHARAAIGFDAVGDLTAVVSKEGVRAQVEAGYPTDPRGRQNVYTNQLWAMRDGIKPGDLVIMPMKTTRRLALGECTSGYQYLPSEGHHRRHTIGVDWKPQTVSRSGIKQDLLNTINGALTVFQAKRNNAEDRLRAVSETGVDPGDPSTDDEPGTPGAPAIVVDSDDAVDPTPTITLGAIRDRVTTFLVENFREHQLTELIAAILRTEGYVCEVSPPGPDHGVDILAGRGPLGLDSPTLIVEVKSEPGPIASPVVRGLQGAMQQHRADQGLLVAWGGINGPAQREVRTDRLTLRVWDADEIVNRLLIAYDRLPDAMRARIPLKQAWVLDEETG